MNGYMLYKLAGRWLVMETAPPLLALLSNECAIGDVTVAT